MMISRAFQDDGWGFSKWHVLALTAKSPEELAEMKKINTRKKSMKTDRVTPMHLAALNPNPEILKYFIEKGDDIYITDQLQRKLIHYAAVCESVEPLKLLISKGIDCRDQDMHKFSPLMYAAQAGRVDNIKLLASTAE